MADLQPLYAALGSTLSADPTTRMQAELEVKRLEKLPGYVPSALQIAVSEQDQSLRMAAAVAFKNKVRGGWFDQIPDADKEVVRQQMVAAIVQASQSIRAQFVTALHFMLNHDFPEKWPAFIDQVGQYLQHTADMNAVYGGLLAMQEVVKIFQYRGRKERGPLNAIVKSVFPYLLQIGTELVQHDHTEAAMMVKVIARTYFASIQSDLSKSHMDPTNLTGWCHFFSSIIAKVVPDAIYGANADADDKAAHPWWKAKKWAFNIFNTLFSRYGNSKSENFREDKKYKPFSQLFMANFVPTLLRSYLALTEQSIQTGAFVSPRVKYLMANFYSDALLNKATWAILKPYAQQLVEHFILPELSISEEDRELWEDDPTEYVHRKVDPMDDFKSPGAGCASLLTSLATNRNNATFAGIVQFIHQVMLAHAAAPTPATLVAKEGALRMLGLLANQCLSKKSPVHAQMEEFLVSFVFPEFASPVKYMRARALDTVAAFADVEYSQPQHALTAFHAAIAALGEGEDLPLRVEAALALKPMIHTPHVRNAMAPHIAAIMKSMLDLQNTIDLDVLSTVMEEFVEEFSAEVAPFAVELATQLGATFVRIMADAQESFEAGYDETNIQDMDFDAATDKTMAAMGVIKTMQTLVLSVHENQEIVLQLENAMLPSLIYVLDHEIIDLYPDVFELIDTCTFSLKAVSPTMWSMFERLHKIAQSEAADYVCEMGAALENYISYGKREFATTPQLQQAMVDMINLCLTNTDLGEADRVVGCGLMHNMLMYLRGTSSIDHLVPHFLDLAMHHIGTGAIKTTAFLIAAIEVGITALYYDPALTLRVLEEKGMTAAFFTAWIGNVGKMARVHDKKLGVITLCTVLSAVPAEHLPAVVVQGLPQLFGALVNYLSTLPKAEANRAEQEKFFTGIDEIPEEELERLNNADLDTAEAAGDDAEEVVEGDDEDGDGWEDEEEDLGLHHLAGQAARARADLGGDEWADDDEDWSDDEDLDEEFNLETPLDDVDPYVTFAATFTALQASSPAVYQQLTAGATAEHQNVVMQAIAKASENQAKAAAKAAAGSA
ncbi:Nonsense-mediated mRNA decay protein 5 [Blastocladiella emersonii ATCC 22665]|nr:Nonsense-mediated mRNA decay protein 5 [Blastocladiella emersonii ATCC 22665]